jgi:predicted small metal-binding protein
VADPLKYIRCPCGFEVRSRDEAELVRMATLHVRDIHGQELSDEQARALIQIAA